MDEKLDPGQIIMRVYDEENKAIFVEQVTGSPDGVIRSIDPIQIWREIFDTETVRLRIIFV